MNKRSYSYYFYVYVQTFTNNSVDDIHELTLREKITLTRVCYEVRGKNYIF